MSPTLKFVKITQIIFKKYPVIFIHCQIKVISLKAAVSPHFSYVNILSTSSALRAITFVFSKEMFENECK